jgi:signal transduction histidine kinase/DNA-binding response OmpR family regulator
MSEPGAEATGGSDLFRSGGLVGRDLALVDWSSTSLGPPEGWPQSLTSAVGTVLRSRFSMWMAWGPDLTFFCNEAYRQETLGTKYPAALGRPANEVWPEIWDQIGPRIERVMTTGEATWDEGLLLFLERSGYREETYHTFSYSPLAAEDGSIAGMLCVVIEDTDRVIGARRMSTLRRLGDGPLVVGDDRDVLASVAHSLAIDLSDIPFAVIYTLGADRTVACLQGTSGIETGHAAAPEVIDLASSDVPWPFAQAMAGESVVVDDLSGRFGSVPSGGWDDAPSQAVVVPLAQPGRADPAGFLVAGLNPYRMVDDGYRSFLDLVAGQVAARLTTARAYSAERERAEQLAELDRAKTAFFTNISHEFRTPLTLLLGPLEDALRDEDDPLPPVQRLRAEVMQRNAVRLLSLVNTLLDFSRLEAGRVEPRFEGVDLSRYTSELASAFTSATDRAGLAFHVDCPPLGEPVWVDQDSWAKIVLNLLSNALKFTFEGSITVGLRTEAGKGTLGAGDVVLSVIDTGVGIAPEEQDRLFERFYRAQASRARTYEGSGIGLALVAELAALHGGTVGVTSTIGHGSQFTVRIPRGRAHLPAERIIVTDDWGVEGGGTPPPEWGGTRSELVAEASRWLARDSAEAAAPGRSEAPASADDQRPKVLVIDDNDDMRSYISRLLADDYVVLTAANGVEGVARARDARPDLVVSDVMMPQLDGYGVLDALRAEPATEHIPVVLLSARAGQESTVEGIEAGADDYLVKPFTARELLARVRANVEMDRARRIRASLERSQILLDQAQRIARVGSWELDIASGSVEASEELLRQLQMSAEELRAVGLEGGLVARVHPDDLVPFRTAIFESAATGQPLDHEVRIVTPDGVERTYRTMGDVIVDDGRVRLRGANQDITDQRETQRAVADAVAAREVAAREHRIADELQRSLVPAPGFSPDGLSIATYYRPGVEGTQVGGDWYDVVDLGAGRTALILGDVMGRGVRAAAVMGQLRAAIRAYAQLDLRPADILSLIDVTVRSLGDDQIVTCVYAVYDPDDQTLTYANAGHLPPILIGPEGEPVHLLGASGPPLGVGPLAVDAEQIPFPPDTTLLLYTDGLVERRGTDIDRGMSRLVDALARVDGSLASSPGELVAAMLPDGPDDDVAVLVATTAPAGNRRHFSSFPVAFEASAVKAARDVMRGILEEWEVAADDTERVLLALSEMVTNAIVHGRPPIEVHVRMASSALIVQVFDAATSIPRRARPGVDDEHGRGLVIIERLAERWGIRPAPSGKAVWASLAIRA